MIRLRNILALLRGQFWIIPALVTMFAGGVALVVLRYGSSLLAEGSVKFWWLYSGDASTARNLLSSLLSGLITMTSLVLSLTFVILTLAANQLGPRLITIFISDRQIQLVLGLFLGTILYIILVLRTLNDTLGVEGVPHVAITVASVLTILCLFSLLFYVDKIGRSIVADNVVRQVSDTIQQDISDLLPADATSDQRPPTTHYARQIPIALCHRGYIQVIDYEKLVAICRKADCMLQLNVQAGDFALCQGNHILLSVDQPPDEDLHHCIRDAFTIGSQRTSAQDPRYGLSQLVEIALRALSPGINDPRTAVAVIEQLGAVFEEMLMRSAHSSILKDEDGVVRVIAHRINPPGLLASTFDPLRQAAANLPGVLLRMVDILLLLSPTARGDNRKAVLMEIEKLAETAQLGNLARRDRDEILELVETARAAMEK